MIVDFPDADKKKLAEYFFYRIANEKLPDVYFLPDSISAVPRAILTGDADTVMMLVRDFRLHAETA